MTDLVDIEPVEARPAKHVPTKNTIANIPAALEINVLQYSTRTADAYEAIENYSHAKVILWMLKHKLDPKSSEAAKFTERITKVCQVRVFMPRIRSYGIDDEGTAYAVTDYYAGRPLAATPRPPEELERVYRDMVQRIAQFHRSDIVLGDICDQSFVVDGNGNVTFVGILGAVRTEKPESFSDLPGSLLMHVAPEQLKGNPPTFESDVYALGISGYQLITRRSFADWTYSDDLLKKNILDRVPLPSHSQHDVPPWSDEVISKCLQTNPKRRYRNAVELVSPFEVKDEVGLRPQESSEPFLIVGLTVEQIIILVVTIFIFCASMLLTAHLAERTGRKTPLTPFLKMFLEMKFEPPKPKISFNKLKLSPAIKKTPVPSPIFVHKPIRIRATSTKKGPTAEEIAKARLKELERQQSEESYIHTIALLKEHGFDYCAYLFSRWQAARIVFPGHDLVSNVFRPLVQKKRSGFASVKALKHFSEKHLAAARQLAAALVLDGHVETFLPVLASLSEQESDTNPLEDESIQRLLIILPDLGIFFERENHKILDKFSDKDIAWGLLYSASKREELLGTLASETLRRKILPPINNAYLQALTSEDVLSTPPGVKKGLVRAAFGRASPRQIQALSMWEFPLRERVLYAMAFSLESPELKDQVLAQLASSPNLSEPGYSVVNLLKLQDWTQPHNAARAVGAICLAEEESVSYQDELQAHYKLSLIVRASPLEVLVLTAKAGLVGNAPWSPG